MTKKEIIDKAKIVVFPFNGVLKEFDDIETINLSTNAPTYSNFVSNEHHFTTNYHYKEVLPTINKSIKFGFNINDWTKISNILQKEDKVIDLSYLTPKIDKSFTAYDLINDTNYDCKFDGLLYNDNVKNLTWRTKYHALYAFPHWCSRIVNHDKNNGRILLVIGDSQSIPDIPIYAYYFKEVWYIDNRYNNHIYDKYMKDVYFDDVLIGFWGSRKDIKFYTRYIR